jgi:hypothetical protein
MFAGLVVVGRFRGEQQVVGWIVLVGQVTATPTLLHVYQLAPADTSLRRIFEVAGGIASRLKFIWSMFWGAAAFRS